jgi:hypothetical protein
MILLGSTGARCRCGGSPQTAHRWRGTRSRHFLRNKNARQFPPLLCGSSVAVAYPFFFGQAFGEPPEREGRATCSPRSDRGPCVLSNEIRGVASRSPGAFAERSAFSRAAKIFALFVKMA